MTPLIVLVPDHVTVHSTPPGTGVPPRMLTSTVFPKHLKPVGQSPVWLPPILTLANPPLPPRFAPPFLPEAIVASRPLHAAPPSLRFTFWLPRNQLAVPLLQLSAATSRLSVANV